MARLGHEDDGAPQIADADNKADCVGFRHAMQNARAADDEAEERAQAHHTPPTTAARMAKTMTTADVE